MSDIELSTQEWVIEVNPLGSIVEVDSRPIEVIEVAGSQGPAGVTGQAADDDLSAIANLSTVGLIERTGNGTATTTVVTAYIKSLLQAVDAAAAKTILGVGATGMPYSSTNRSGATSATPNVWTQIITLTSLSDHLFIGNPIGSTSILDIGFGAAGAETLQWRISPGRSARVESRDRISIRCAVASQPYLASEAVYL